MSTPATMRRLAVALVGLLLLLLAPVSQVIPPVAAATGAAEAVRGSQEVVTTRRDGTVRVRPLVTVTTADGREALAQRLIVGYRPGVGTAERAAVHRVSAAGGTTTRVLAPIGPNAELLFITNVSSLDAAVQRYQADPRVAYAEPDYVLRAARTPNDPLFSQQWGMTRIRAPEAWDVTVGSPSRLIAVLDCGINEAGASLPYGRPGHPDLNNKVVARTDFTGSPYGADDRCDHGTHVAGIAAAATNNGIGVAGVGFQSRLLNGKVLDDDGSGATAWVALGIRWAADNGAHVINLSLNGVGSCSSTMQSAIAYAATKQVVVVAAAGNDGSSLPTPPSSCNHVIGVGSTNQSDQRSSFSNYGASWVDVAAPGERIASTATGGGYIYLSGTSMAAPHVAGLAALLWATGAFLSAQAVADRIAVTTDATPDTGSAWRAGRVNAQRAVSGLQPTITVDGGHTMMGAKAPAQRWFFVEGYTAPGFDEYLTILNPNLNQVTVTIRYYLEGGFTEVTTRAVPAQSRTTIAVHDTVDGVGRAGAVAAQVETEDPGGIVVERPTYFRYAQTIGGGDTTLGATQAATTWYFAEGWTGDGFDEYLSILNPTDTLATVTITYFLAGGKSPIVNSRTVAARSRATVVVHDPIDGVGRGQAVSARVTSDGVGIVVERPIYFRYGNGIDGGHNVMGANATAMTWYFAEGYTGDGFDEYLTILNPADAPAPVTVTYFLSDGSTKDHVLTVAATSRATVVVHDPVEGVGRGKAVSARVTTPASAGIVVERPIYFRYSPTVKGGHNVMGATSPATTWYLAEGWTGDGFDEYLTILNPSPSAAPMTITYFLATGGTKIVNLTVLPTSRATVVVHDDAQGVGRNQAVSARVTTTNPLGVVVERPIYFTYLLT